MTDTSKAPDGREWLEWDYTDFLRLRATSCESDGLRELAAIWRACARIVESALHQPRDPLLGGGDGRVSNAGEWSDEECAEFMAVALRHVEYKRCNPGPSVSEIRQGLHRIGAVRRLASPPSGAVPEGYVLVPQNQMFKHILMLESDGDEHGVARELRELIAASTTSDSGGLGREVGGE